MELASRLKSVLLFRILRAEADAVVSLIVILYLLICSSSIRVSSVARSPSVMMPSISELLTEARALAAATDR